MKANIKKVSAIVFGLAIITAIFALIQLNSATAAKENGKKFDDWIVSCSKEDKETNKPAVCLLTQQVNLNKDGKDQTIAVFRMGYFGEKKELRLHQTLPLGVNVQAGTSIISSKNLIAPGQYSTCLSSGCMAVSNISDADLKTLLSNTENSIAFMNFEGKQITLPFSIKGLKKGLKYIK